MKKIRPFLARIPLGILRLGILGLGVPGGILFWSLGTSPVSFGEESNASNDNNKVEGALVKAVEAATNSVNEAKRWLHDIHNRHMGNRPKATDSSNSHDSSSDTPQDSEHTDPEQEEIDTAQQELRTAEAMLASAQVALDNHIIQTALMKIWAKNNEFATKTLAPHLAKPEGEQTSPLGQALENWLAESKKNFNEDSYLASLREQGFSQEEANQIVQHNKQFLEQAIKAVSFYNSGNRFLARDNRKAVQKAEDFWNKSILLTLLGPYQNTPTQAGMAAALSGLRKLFHESEP